MALPTNFTLRADGAVTVNDGPPRTMTLLWPDGAETWLDIRLAVVFGLDHKSVLDIAGDCGRRLLGQLFITAPGVRRLVQHMRARVTQRIVELETLLADIQRGALGIDDRRLADFGGIEDADLSEELEASLQSFEEDISDPRLSFDIGWVMFVFIQPNQGSAPPPSWLYFIESSTTGLIKIGVTNDVGKRARALASQGGMQIRILATMAGHRDDEQALHRRFAAHRRIGEWFAPAQELLTFIESLQATDKAVAHG